MNWSESVREVAFAPWGMGKELAGVALSRRGRQAWAASADLLFAASVLTQDVVVSQCERQEGCRSGFYKAFLQRERGPDGSDFAPVVFTSAASGGQPPFFPAGGMEV